MYGLGLSLGQELASACLEYGLSHELSRGLSRGLSSVLSSWSSSGLSTSRWPTPPELAQAWLLGRCLPGDKRARPLPPCRTESSKIPHPGRPQPPPLIWPETGSSPTFSNVRRKPAVCSGASALVLRTRLVTRDASAPRTSRTQAVSDRRGLGP